MRALILLVILLPGCTLGPKAVPETISLEGGTSVRHEIDQPAVRQNTALVRVLWRLR